MQKMHKQNAKKCTKNAKNDVSFLIDIGGEVVSYWCVAFTILMIPDIIAIFGIGYTP
jgi:hypothetical protein